MKRLRPVAAWAYGDANLADRGDAEHVHIARASGNLLDALGARTALGRWFTPDEETPNQDAVLVLTHGLWQRSFAGDASVVGRSVLVDGRPFRIVGVLPDHFAVPGFDAFRPLAPTPAQLAETSRGNHFLRVLARLAPGATLASAQAELDGLSLQLRAASAAVYPEAGRFRLTASPLLEETVGKIRPALWMLFGAVLLVLLIACANVAGLQLARATGRERELAVRAALGADRGQLVRQLLVESVFLALAGGLLGVLLAQWGMDLLLALVPSDLPRLDEIRIDGAVLAFALGTSVATGIGFGLLPALAASRADPEQALRAASSGPGVRPARIRSALVAIEVALAILLLAGAGLLLRSFARVLSVDPGFRPDGAVALTVALSGGPAPGSASDLDADTRRFRAFVDESLARVRALPGVTSAGAVDNPPLEGWLSDQIFFVEGVPVAPGATPPDEEYRMATPGYFSAMGIHLLRGRDFQAIDGERGAPVAIVSESLERKHFGGNALGKRLRIDNDSETFFREIVGVVADVREQGLDGGIRPVFFVPVAQAQTGRQPITVVVRSSLADGAAAAAARTALSSQGPSVAVYEVHPLRKLIATSLGQRRFALVLLEAFAAMALLLAALGLYGVLAQTVEQRRREIGVRMALGARTGDVMAMVLLGSARLVVIGLLCGAAASALCARFLAPFLFETDPVDPIALAGAATALLAAAALAAWLPARRATTVDPMVALRAE
jgi:predicted permease